MFPVSKVSGRFSLSKTSVFYIIDEGLAHCFKTVIIVDVKKSYVPFTMNFDERPLHVQVKKQMDMTVMPKEQKWHQGCSFKRGIMEVHDKISLH